MTRKQRAITRAVYGVFILVVTAVVVTSTYQVGRAIFFGAGAESEGSRTTVVGAACGEALDDAIKVIDAARAAASIAPNAEVAKARYDEERRKLRSPEAACASDPSGTDALAALARFDRVSEADALRDVSELRPVRLAAQSFISGRQQR